MRIELRRQVRASSVHVAKSALSNSDQAVLKRFGVQKWSLTESAEMRPDAPSEG